MADHKTLAGASRSLRCRIAGDERLVALVRSDEQGAFEELYERHATELLSFCVYMLGSRQDAEDAVQATFSSAYTALLRDNRPITLRPWLFAIARNDCLSILRRRRPWVELNGEPALGPDPARQLELREELREIVLGVRSLPEHERAALVLTEVHGLSQRETSTVLGVRAEQVKAYVYQARSKLIFEREAREADCRQIREELASARGAALLRGRLRRHMRSCEDCRTYAAGVSRQRRQLASLLPIAPSLALRFRALEQALGLTASDPGYTGTAAVGASVAGAAAEVAGGGIKALAVKIAAGLVAVGAGAGVGVSVLTTPPSSESRSRAAAASRPLLADSAAPSQPRGGPAAARVVTSAGEAGGQPALAGKTAPGGSPQDVGSSGASVPLVGGTGAVDDSSQPDEHTTSTDTGRPLRTPPNDPETAKTEAERKQIESQRNYGREVRLHGSAERKHEREAHGPPGSAKPPKTEEQREHKREARKQAREENPKGHSRAPKNPEERRLHREERLQRREEQRAAEEAEPAP